MVYKRDVHPPRREQRDWRLDFFALKDYIWPEVNLCSSLSNPDKSFTATLFAPYKGGGFDSVDQVPTLLLRTSNAIFPMLPMMPDFCGDYQNNPVGSLRTVRTDPWNLEVCATRRCSAARLLTYGQGYERRIPRRCSSTR
jgi:kynurenine 3-monooxygenase